VRGGLPGRTGTDDNSIIIAHWISPFDSGCVFVLPVLQAIGSIIQRVDVTTDDRHRLSSPETVFLF
jgi:hypothetical protein